jgi:hypothetical protein
MVGERRPVHQQKGDRLVGTDNFNLIVDMVNKGSIVFDSNDFEVEQQNSQLFVRAIRQPSVYNGPFALRRTGQFVVNVAAGLITVGTAANYQSARNVTMSGVTYDGDWWICMSIKEDASSPSLYAQAAVPSQSSYYPLGTTFVTDAIQVLGIFSVSTTGNGLTVTSIIQHQYGNIYVPQWFDVSGDAAASWRANVGQMHTGSGSLSPPHLHEDPD